MIKSDKRKIYKAFGLNIASDITLPELSLNLGKEEIVDISIIEGEHQFTWEEIAEGNEYYVIQEDTIIFRVPKIGIFMMKDGREIVYSPFKNIAEDQLRLYLLGTCIGALLMQRGVLPLHGSAIEINGKAIAIVGDSGAGKSTLASAFLKQGYRLISDDVIPVSLNKENIPIVTPAYPQQKLWLESLNEFGMKSTNFRPIIQREKKFAIPVSNQFSSHQMPLAGVIELVKVENEEIELKPIENLHRLQTLYCHTYRNFFLEPVGLIDWHFKTSIKISEYTNLYKLCRPTTRFTAHELTDLILSNVIKKEEKVYG